MNLEEDNQNLQAAIENDPTGMEEIQHALNEIEKLKGNPEDFVEDENREDNHDNDIEEDLEEIKKPETEKKPDKTWKLKRDKYKFLAEKEEAEKRVRELEELLNESLNASTYHYGKSAYNDLEKAKISKKVAIENGDIEQLVNADEALYKALHAVTELEKYTIKDKQIPQYPEESIQPYREVYDEIAHDWLETHPELERTSGKFNLQLATEVGKFVNMLDNDLKKNNKMDLFFSPDYFDTINEYIDTVKKDLSNKEIRANPSTINSHVGGVRNSYGGGGSVKPSSQITLTADEKRMCANAGLTEKDWIKYKLDDLKTGKKT